jgi:hypothetical protein
MVISVFTAYLTAILVLPITILFALVAQLVYIFSMELASLTVHQDFTLILQLLYVWFA